MNMLTLSHVSKAFGKTKVIDDLSFSVPEHTIFGFIGANGAGKTTTMKMILGLLQLDCGEIYVNGEKACFGQNKTNQYIGYLPDVPEFYGFMTAMEYLKLCGKVTSMSKDEIESRAGSLLELVGLDNTNKRIQGFSRGMKQRLGIAQALLNKPELLICDEPTSALDPAGRKEILDILLSVKEHTTVIFSTHILSDVERICDEIAFLHNGRIALSGTLDEIKAIHNESGMEIEFSRASDADLFANLIAAYEFAGRKMLNGKRVSGAKIHYDKISEEDVIKVMQLLVQNNISVKRLEMLEPTLEDLFMEVVEK